MGDIDIEKLGKTLVEIEDIGDTEYIPEKADNGG